MSTEANRIAANKLEESLSAYAPTYRKLFKAFKSYPNFKQLWDLIFLIGSNSIKTGALHVGSKPEEILKEVLSSWPGDLLWKLNKEIDDPYQRIDIAKNICSILPQLKSEIGSDLPLAEELKETGFVKLNDLLDQQSLNEMIRFFRDGQYSAQDGPTYLHSVEDIVAAPHSLALATNPQILSIVKDYLGAPPTIVDMSVWWTVPTESNDYGAHIFHRDFDDFRACKLFFYLTDVETDDGPHIFARNTHDPTFCAKLIAEHRLPETQLGLLFSKASRGIVGPIEQFFSNQISEITGKAGTAFLEATYGFHRGKTPKRHMRGLFQVLYGLIPYPNRLDRFQNVRIDSLPSSCVDTELSRYAARLMISPPNNDK